MSENRIQEKTTFSKLQKAAAITAAVFVWQIAAMLWNQRILLASPVDVLLVFGRLLFTAAFWQSVAFSIGRIFFGFLLALAGGILLAALSAKSKIARLLLWPYLSAIKATPVASVIILLLVWFSSRNISVLISFFMVLPVIYANVLTGIQMLDPKLEEMAQLYEIGGVRRLLYVRLWQMKPYLIAAIDIGVAMAVKSGTAAEVIGIPGGSIGRKLYDAKIYLATPELFAWTITLIVCSLLMERLVKGVLSGLLTLIERRLS